jgi:hypothetical protein
MLNRYDPTIRAFHEQKMKVIQASINLDDLGHATYHISRRHAEGRRSRMGMVLRMLRNRAILLEGCGKGGCKIDAVLLSAGHPPPFDALAMGEECQMF